MPLRLAGDGEEGVTAVPIQIRLDDEGGLHGALDEGVQVGSDAVTAPQQQQQQEGTVTDLRSALASVVQRVGWLEEAALRAAEAGAAAARPVVMPKTVQVIVPPSPSTGEDLTSAVESLLGVGEEYGGAILALHERLVSAEMVAKAAAAAAGVVVMQLKVDAEGGKTVVLPICVSLEGAGGATATSTAATPTTAAEEASSGTARASAGLALAELSTALKALSEHEHGLEEEVAHAMKAAMGAGRVAEAALRAATVELPRQVRPDKNHPS